MLENLEIDVLMETALDRILAIARRMNDQNMAALAALGVRGKTEFQARVYPIVLREVGKTMLWHTPADAPQRSHSPS